MKTDKLKFLTAVAATLAILLTGCSTSSGTAQTSQSSETAAPASSTASADATSSSNVDLSGVTLRVGITGNGELQQKLFDAAGLSDTAYKLEFSSYTGSQLALQAMAADQIDLATSSETPPLFASLTEGGGNFKIVATSKANTQLQDLIVGPNSTIQSVADLKGKKVGYIQATTSQYFLLKMLEEAGLSWSDIEPVNLSPSDGLAALLAGDISAFAVFGNQINADLAQGGKVLESAENILSGNFLVEASDLALNDSAKSAAIVDYLSRVEKANKWIRNNYEAWAVIAADANGMTTDDYVAYLKNGDAQRETHILATTDSDLASLQDVADAFYGVGSLEKKIDVKTLYSDVLAEQIKEKVETAAQ